MSWNPTLKGNIVKEMLLFHTGIELYWQENLRFVALEKQNMKTN